MNLNLNPTNAIPFIIDLFVKFRVLSVQTRERTFISNSLFCVCGWMQYANDAARAAAFSAFLANDLKVQSFNSQETQATFTLGHNEFSDLTSDEFNAIYLNGNGLLDNSRYVSSMDMYVDSSIQIGCVKNTLQNLRKKWGKVLTRCPRVFLYKDEDEIVFAAERISGRIKRLDRKAAKESKQKEAEAKECKDGDEELTEAKKP